MSVCNSAAAYYLHCSSFDLRRGQKKGHRIANSKTLNKYPSQVKATAMDDVPSAHGCRVKSSQAGFAGSFLQHMIELDITESRFCSRFRGCGFLRSMTMSCACWAERLPLRFLRHGKMSPLPMKPTFRYPYTARYIGGGIAKGLSLEDHSLHNHTKSIRTLAWHIETGATACSNL